ncbi:toll/interleukin-1 receptor domain-containing protein [Bradyrhizobium stylosanthis]|uniref:TIR domain-containing protein n=1 Tax=Bradyrhizobium stylosanthis TaxID=1803665 RepID=A0A560CVX3_9BRAD|nr:toll/interleukin-1 receptor domain-containing protein [Bradyrhizobium stylosanthis]TWA88991.1 TIR domain-containing protein [Bradyrhizobium stylosanthis]
MATLFLSYSHRDEPLRAQLETHLAGLHRQGFIAVWHDRRITAGDDFAASIDAHLEAADIVLLLVSPDFIASDYCYEKEMSRALERHQAGSCTVVPVILRPCDWHDLPFGRLLATPTDGRAITLWPNIDEAFLDVVKAIKTALGKIKQGSPPPARRALRPPPAPSVAAVPRSSNLRVTKLFTDQDKETFLNEAFDYMARFFEASLTELHTRNPEIEGRFRRVDGNFFTAVAYRNGNAVARCSIRLGGGSGPDITFSYNASPDNTSYNESLSVGHDTQQLYLAPLGMTSMRRSSEDNEGKLSFEGGAELYWELFIEPLQRN